MTNVLICSYLEAEQVERIRAAEGVVVSYVPELLPRPRYAADHVGAPFRRSPQQQEQWHTLLSHADVLFDIDRSDIGAILEYARSVRWIQATSAGIGPFVKRHGLDKLGALITTASGIHAVPLAEFVCWAMLTFVKDYPTARAQQERQVWERFSSDELEGKTLVLVGFGAVGREVARRASALGVGVVATKRSVGADDVRRAGDVELVPVDRLEEVVARADFLCLAAPQTPATDGMIDANVLAAMKPSGVLINIARGSLVDEPALVRALRDGALAGAVLDVAAQEPLPEGHPLWSMPNVIIFPHSASTSRLENRRLTDLFLENLSRLEAGRPLINVFDPARGY